MKRVFALILSAAVCAALAGCGSSSSSASAPASGSASASAAAGETVTITIGASPSPHAEILEAAAPILAEQGIELDIVEFDDYVLPNTALDDGSLDANYFQHQPYLTNFNAENGTDLVSAG